MYSKSVALLIVPSSLCLTISTLIKLSIAKLQLVDKSFMFSYANVIIILYLAISISFSRLSKFILFGLFSKIFVNLVLSLVSYNYSASSMRESFIILIFSFKMENSNFYLGLS